MANTSIIMQSRDHLLQKNAAASLREAHKRMESSMLGVNSRGKIENEYLIGRNLVRDIATHMERRKVSWTGHLVD